MAAATRAEKRRFSIMQDIGCVACIIEGELRNEDRRGTPPDIHHLIDGYRRGHKYTVALCPWHHRGVKPSTSVSTINTRIELGPSLANQPLTFTFVYGHDEILLKKQNELITNWAEDLIA